MHKSILTLSLFLLAFASAFAEGPSKENFDWESWRYLPVQEGGRQKPLDTLARESMRMLTNRADFADPETGQRLDATAFYLAHALRLAGLGPAEAAAGRRGSLDGVFPRASARQVGPCPAALDRLHGIAKIAGHRRKANAYFAFRRTEFEA